MPLAFVPDWRKADYIDNRATLDYSVVKQEHLIPLPKYESMKTDFNSLFTYLTVFRGKYMDETRTPNTGSHDGVDIRAPIGTPVFAIGHGKVVQAKDDKNNKYITIEHKNVKYNGKVGTYYSSYLHLSEVLVYVGQVVDKWTLIWRVGMTGFTTTPHLHLQVDNESAPFYPYWPFTLTEAATAGYSFFDGVDAGLNQDLIAKYSVDPIDFVKNATGIETPTQTTTTTLPTQKTPIETTPTPTEPVQIEKPIETTPTAGTNTWAFPDVPTTHKNYTAISYLAKKGVISGFSNGTFGPDKLVTRSEILGIVLKALDIAPHGEIVTGVFRDIPGEHWVNPLVSEAVKRKIVTTERPFFEPDRAVTRIELLAIIGIASGEDIFTGISKRWADLDWSHWGQKYAQFGLTYNLFDDIGGNIFNPNKELTRGEVAEAVYRYLTATARIR